MAHFAKIKASGVVCKVVVVDDSVAPTEQAGVDFLRTMYKEPAANWKQTSYNTLGGKYQTQDEDRRFVEAADQSKSFRKNFASLGGTYDAAKDAFIPPQPFPSWVLDDDTCLWDAPTPRPSPDGEDFQPYEWDEASLSWIPQN